MIFEVRMTGWTGRQPVFRGGRVDECCAPCALAEFFTTCADDINDLRAAGAEHLSVTVAPTPMTPAGERATHAA